MHTSLYIALETYSQTYLCVGSILIIDNTFHMLQALYMPHSITCWDALSIGYTHLT